MSQNLRYWRNAATLILAGPKKIEHICSLAGRPNASNGSQLAKPRSARDYQVLMLKRSDGSSFMAGAYVYPGGETSEADFSTEWSSLFSSVTARSANVVARDLSVKGLRPPVLQHNLAENSKLCPDIAYRICAIRETFEECGILLVTNSPGDRNQLTEQSHLYMCDERRSELEQWRERVRRDAWQFLDLCRYMKVVPDVWALTEWSNWLTPALVKVDGPSAKPRRFDTVFYMCCLDHIPDAKHDAQEITHAEWVEVNDVLLSKQYKVIGPQLYETSRMARFDRLHDLFGYIRKREPLGMQRWLPVYYTCKDGFIGVMPGDDMYPEFPDVEGTEGHISLDMTVEEARQAGKIVHRHENVEGMDRQYACNMRELPCGQVPPSFDAKYASSARL